MHILSALWFYASPAKRQELLANGVEVHDFYFEGDDQTYFCHCLNEKPHPPHLVGHYQTASWGLLENFCIGREGQTDKGYLRIRITEWRSGNPATPEMVKGFWYIERPKEVEA